MQETKALLKIREKCISITAQVRNCVQELQREVNYVLHSPFKRQGRTEYIYRKKKKPGPSGKNTKIN